MIVVAHLETIMLGAVTTSVSAIDSLIQAAPQLAAVVIIVVAFVWYLDRSSKRDADALQSMGKCFETGNCAIASSLDRMTDEMRRRDVIGRVGDSPIGASGRS